MMGLSAKGIPALLLHPGVGVVVGVQPVLGLINTHTEERTGAQENTSTKRQRERHTDGERERRIKIEQAIGQVGELEKPDRHGRQARQSVATVLTLKSDSRFSQYWP